MKSLALLVPLVFVLPAQAQSTFDRIARAYGDSLDRNDPLSFDLKISQLATDRYTYWRGSKDLFFDWARIHCNDWLSKPDQFITTHGDLHAGNIGAYLVDIRSRELAFGLVDFDESSRLPFQLELLQGFITLQLASPDSISADQQNSLRKTMVQSYRVAVLSQRDAVTLLQDVKPVTDLLNSRADYRSELEQYTHAGRFTSRVVNAKGKLREILRPIDDTAPYASALQQAIDNSPELGRLMKPRSSDEVRKSVKAVALRTRLGSIGSQGLRKVMVLVDKPIKGVDHDIIFYFKQQIPSAAERAGAIPRDTRDPGRRCAEDQLRLTDPAPIFASHATVNGVSYWVHLKEPWSEELDASDFDSFDKLQDLARIWGTVAGVAHRRGGPDGLYIGETLDRQLDASTIETLSGRADQFVSELDYAYANLRDDPRTRECIARVKKRLED
jgi:uncharacterized protein (DUF2252 family)